MLPRRNRANPSSSSVVRSWPSAVTDPELARSNPPISINSDDLPDPDGPISPKVSPRSTFSVMPRKISTGPALPCNVSRASFNARMVSFMSVPYVFPPSYGPFRPLRNVTIAILLWLLAANSAFAEKLTVVALGDSLTAGYGLAPEFGFVPVLQNWLQANGQDVTVENAGVSGDTTAGGLARLDWALSPGANVMIVNLGGNDLLRGLDPAQSLANIDKILATADAKHLPVLLVGLKALNNYGPDYKAKFDAIYPALAAKYHTLYIEDYFGPIKSSQAELTANLQADGLHPNAAGVVKIVDAMGPMVVKLLEEAK